MKLAFAMFAVIAALPGCGDVDNDRLEREAHGLGCGATRYAALEPSAYAAATARVGALAAVRHEIDEAIAAPEGAAHAFDEIQGIYRGSEGLRAAVQGLEEGEGIGEQIDLAIASAIARGGAASDADAAAAAGAAIEAALVRFFYLAALRDLELGTRAALDEAAAYLGTGPENRADEALAIAAIARAGDAALAEEMFAATLESACVLDRELLRRDASAIDAEAYLPYAERAERVEDAATRAAALGVARGAVETDALDEAASRARVQEPAALFEAIEADMVARGAEADAAAIDEMFRKAINVAELEGDPARALDVPFIVERIEAIYGVAP
jgi:hypothetical protein